MKMYLRSRSEGAGASPVRFHKGTILVAVALLILVCSEGLPFSAAADLTAVNQTELRNSAVILVKNTLISVNQANLTGNYTVLRDLSSPGFRERNDGAMLATIFENLRKQKIDLSPIVVLEPVLSRPKLSDDGTLLLKGHFPSEPVRISFELMYQQSATGGWMIHGVSINTAQSDVVAANEAESATSPRSASQGTPTSRVIPVSGVRAGSENAASRPKTVPVPSTAAPVRRQR